MGKLMLCGGMTQEKMPNSQCFSLSQVPGSRWRREADLPTTQSLKAAHVVAGGRAFIFGGLEEEVPLPSVYIIGGSQVVPGRHALQSVDLVERKGVWDTSAVWTTMPALKQARAEHGCAVIKDSKGRTGILVVGGTGDKSCVGSSVEFLNL